MSSLKALKTDLPLTSDVSHDKSIDISQMELPFDNDVPETTNVIVLPKIPDFENDSKSDSKNDLQDKKDSILTEIERLNQYLLQKQKKFQEAKTFIEQYERVVVNKKRFIDEVEVERNAIIKEIEILKTSKEKLQFEFDDISHDMGALKKNLASDKNDLAQLENKIYEKKVEFSQLEKSLQDIKNKKEINIEQGQEAENELRAILHHYGEKKNQIEILTSELEQLNIKIDEKRSEIDNLKELCSHFQKGHLQIEAELASSIERLKSDEATWRLLVNERTNALDNTEIQLTSMQAELKECHIELDMAKNALSNEKNKLLHVGDLVQKEQLEAHKWQDKASQLQEKVGELKSNLHELELTVMKEATEVEFIRNKRILEEQEQYKLVMKKENLISTIAELELKKQGVDLQIKDKYEEAMGKLSEEIALKDQEAKTFRAAREEEFQKNLRTEKTQMKEIFWSDLYARLYSLSDEVSNYIASCLHVNLNPEQKEKLNNHISSLAKHYHSLDTHQSRNKLHSITRLLRVHQHYFLISLVIVSITALILQIVK